MRDRFRASEGIFWYVIVDRKCLETYKRGILDKTVRTEVVVTHTPECAGYIGVVTFGTPTLEHCGRLVLVIIHALKVHTSLVDDLLTETAVEEGCEQEVLPFEFETTAGGEFRVGVAEIHDVVLVDHAVVVDILVTCVTGIYCLVAVVHYNGLAFIIVHHITLAVAGICLGGVLVDTLVTVAVECTDRRALDNAQSVFTVTERVVFLYVGRGEFLHLIYITRDVGVEREVPVLIV